MERTFAEVDVFTAVPYLGNPLAVVLGADDLSAEQMRRFANWTNFSETTFVTAPSEPSADYGVRIFTPSEELPFAGHPTIGTCHIWLENGGVPKDRDHIVQECGIGLISLRRQGANLAFAAPSLLRSGPADAATVSEAAVALGIDEAAILDCEWIDNGPRWLGVLLASAEDVLAITPAPSDLNLGVIGPHPAGSSVAYEVRAFFTVNGATLEDPVTGSLNASAAQWMIRTGRFSAPYTALQGTAMGRAGVVKITTDNDGGVWVGGSAVTCVNGTVEL